MIPEARESRRHTQIRYMKRRMDEGRIPHGEPYGYTLGCREECCKQAMRTHQKKYASV